LNALLQWGQMISCMSNSSPYSYEELKGCDPF
jgi:hypothetical protein